MNNSRALYLRTKGNTIIIINYNLIISKVKFRILDTTLLPGCLVLFSLELSWQVKTVEVGRILALAPSSPSMMPWPGSTVLTWSEIGRLLGGVKEDRTGAGHAAD
jgi:hypothetical protein